MLRIHLIVPRYHTNLDPIVSEFLNLGHEIRIFTFSQSIAEIRKHHRNLEFIDLNSKNVKFNILTSVRILAKAIRHNTNYSNLNLYFARCETSKIGISIMFAIFISRIRHETVIYTQYPIRKMKFHQSLWKLILKNILHFKYFSQVLDCNDSTTINYRSISEYTNDLSRRLSEFPEFIPLAIPMINLKEVKNSSLVKQKNDFKSFISVVKCEPRKGVSGLIDSFNDFYPLAINKWKLRIIFQVLNEKHEAYLKFLLNRYGLGTSQNIEIFVNFTTDETREMIGNSDVFILNSIREPASFSHLEALALHVPIIINRDNGSSNVLPGQFGVQKIADLIHLQKAMFKSDQYFYEQHLEIGILHAELEKILGAHTLAKKWLSIAKQTNS